MLKVGPCNVDVVRFEPAEFLEVQTVGGSSQWVQTSQMGTVTVDVSIPVTDLAEQSKMMEAYTEAGDVEFAGYAFRITAYAVTLLEGGWIMELTLHGRAPVEQTSEIMAQIGRGDQAVTFPTGQRLGPGAQALKEAGQEAIEKLVRRNQRLGTLDELA